MYCHIKLAFFTGLDMIPVVVTNLQSKEDDNRTGMHEALLFFCFFLSFCCWHQFFFSFWMPFVYICTLNISSTAFNVYLVVFDLCLQQGNDIFFHTVSKFVRQRTISSPPPLPSPPPHPQPRPLVGRRRRRERRLYLIVPAHYRKLSRNLVLTFHLC